MIKSVILIDNKYFVGTDPELVLSFNVNEAKILEGFINLRSCVDSILNYFRCSDLCFEEISILNI